MAKKKNNGGTTAPKSAAKGSTTAVQNAHAAQAKKQIGVAGNGAPGSGKGNQKGKGKKDPHAGETYNPGVKNAPVDPFMTGEDIMAYAQARQQYEGELGELDFNYANSIANSGYEKSQLTKGAIADKAASSDDMAARGLFRSSVRDADLFDIDATAEMRKTFLDTQLNTLKLHTESRKKALDNAWGDYEYGVALKKKANAEQASEGMPEYAVDPGWVKNQPPGPKPNPNAPKQNSELKNPGPYKFKTNSAIPTKTGGTQAPKKAAGGYTTQVSNQQAPKGSKNIKGKLYG